MGFDEDKKRYLERLFVVDKSKKGSIDEAILPLINAINKDPDFYTTSSCAGRITLFVEPESGKKCDAEWLFVTHEKTSLEEVAPHLKRLPSSTVWFRMEGAIIHVVARNEARANELLHKARESGFKHSGILSTTRRIVVECIDTSRIDVPISANGSLIVPIDFIKFLIEKANKKLESTRKAINSLLSKF